MLSPGKRQIASFMSGRAIMAAWTALAALAAPGGSARPQSPTTTSETGFDDLPVRSEWTAAQPKLPQLVFRMHADIPLPGPLPGGSPRAVDSLRVHVPVHGALAVTLLERDAAPVLVPLDPARRPSGPDDPPSPWVLSADGRQRYQTRPSGLVVAERCCSEFSGGWYRLWKLRLPAGTVVPPLLVDRRVLFVAALDNQLYALRARNGHRLWTAELGRRLSRPLACWTGGPKPAAGPGDHSAERRTSLILVVPDDGSELLALDAATGRKVATVRLPDGDGQIVGGPLSTAQGKIVVARQKYAESEASLLVFTLEEPPAANVAADGTTRSPDSDEDLP
jgi:hypothetical protein